MMEIEGAAVVAPLLDDLFNLSMSLVGRSELKLPGGSGDDTKKEATEKPAIEYSEVRFEDGNEGSEGKYRVLYRAESDGSDPLLDSDGEEIKFYPLGRSMKFSETPPGDSERETILNIVKSSYVLEEEEEDTRRKVYWSGPGLLQERHTKSIFQPQEIPEGIRPTLNYVSSEEMVSTDLPSTQLVYLNNLGRPDLPQLQKKKSEKKKSVLRRMFESIMKAVR